MRELSTPVAAIAAPVVMLGTHGITWDGAVSPPLHLNASALSIATRFDGSATSTEVADLLFAETQPSGLTTDELATVVARVADTLDAYGILRDSPGYGLDAAAQMLPRDPST